MGEPCEHKRTLNEIEKNDARAAFKLFDKKDCGKISIKELGNVFRSLGRQLKPDQLKEWADDIDVDGKMSDNIHCRCQSSQPEPPLHCVGFCRVPSDVPPFHIPSF
ncbi:troponin C [Lingula anatina]|uniref:Troponin C n=1 Tax=Lingula anatina TaxID=7574 RepID=A0A2R2MKC2_LINAN|nr:troponin C [Lingula anatina]|eukprot:XP_023930512.1 troponin C [Lingula anatina]